MSGKPRRESFWLDHIRKAEQSGQTISAYAKASKLDLQQLYNWRRKLRVAGKLNVASVTVPFARVVCAEPIAQRNDVALVVSIGHLRLHFDRLPDVDWLAQAILALEPAP